MTNLNEIIKTPSSVSKYSTPAMAFRVANRSVKPQSVLMGNDGKFWVVPRGLGEQLHRAGLEYCPRHTSR